MAEIGVRYDLITPAGTIVFNGFDNNPASGYTGNYFRLTAVDGVDSPTLRTPLDSRPQLDGAIIYDFFRGAHYPDLQGTVVTSNLSSRRSMEDTLRGCMASILRADGMLRWYPTGADMLDTDNVTNIAQKRQLTVRAFQPVQISGSGIAKDFRLGLVSGDHAKVSSVEYTKTDSSAPFSVTVNNQGDYETWPTIKVVGPSSGTTTGFTITNSASAAALIFTFTSPYLGSGHTVTVKMKERTIDINGANALGTLQALVSSFFASPAGSSTISLTSITGTNPSQLQVLYRSAWA